MDDHLIRFHGPGTIAEIVHSGPFLRGVLDALVDGCQQATRLLVEGRSSAAGTPPSWLEQAAAFQVRQLRDAEIVLDTRPLGDALPPGLPKVARRARGGVRRLLGRAPWSGARRLRSQLQGPATAAPGKRHERRAGGRV